MTTRPWCLLFRVRLLDHFSSKIKKHLIPSKTSPIQCFTSNHLLILQLLFNKSSTEIERNSIDASLSRESVPASMKEICSVIDAMFFAQHREGSLEYGDPLEANARMNQLLAQLGHCPNQRFINLVVTTKSYQLDKNTTRIFNILFFLAHESFGEKLLKHDGGTLQQ